MAVNKVNYGGTTLIDLTDTTAEAVNVESGAYFYTKYGIRTQGSMTVKTIYTGTAAPSSSIGTDGDIYIQTGS